MSEKRVKPIPRTVRTIVQLSPHVRLAFEGNTIELATPMGTTRCSTAELVELLRSRPE